MERRPSKSKGCLAHLLSLLVRGESGRRGMADRSGGGRAGGEHWWVSLSDLDYEL